MTDYQGNPAAEGAAAAKRDNSQKPTIKQHTGFSDATYTGVCALMGIDKYGCNTGMNNQLWEIHSNDFSKRSSYTIGDVFDALIKSYLYTKSEA